MTKALVTGAAGFVGPHLVRACLAQGWDTVGIDVKPAKENGVEFILADLADKAAVAKLVRDVDYVFHEAAASSSLMFEPDPYKGVEVNVMGGTGLLQACAEAGVRRFVYASTSSIYGDLPLPWREDVAIPAAPNAYAASKLAFEYLAKVYTLRGELETVGLRYFSIYGPGERVKGPYANMISQFLWAMKKGEPVVIYGDGEQTRDFTYVDDVVAANLRALKTAAVGEVFNVGTARETSINRMVGILSDILGKGARTKFVPNPIKNYVRRTLADTTKAEKLLGFKASVAVAEGVRRLVQGGEVV